MHAHTPWCARLLTSFVLFWGAVAVARPGLFEPDLSRPEEGTYSDGAIEPFSGPPLSEMVFVPKQLSIEPQVILVQVNATVPGADTVAVRLPALGLKAKYAFFSRLSVFLNLYGTRLPSDFETRPLSGRLTLSMLAGSAGAAVNILGGGPSDRVRLSAIASLNGFVVRAALSAATALERTFATVDLFRLRGMGAVLGVQLEWRFWRYLAVVPYVTGWRLLAVSQKLGAAQREFGLNQRWHVTTGVDFWVYLSAQSKSHLSLGSLVNFTADKPVTTFVLSYAFVFDLDRDKQAR